ncbi:hypothetical protein P7H90_08050 [Lactococcus lactis]|uniref:hypothetical protein n=1 Tax=Lactococcus lactis TaxID=1358 RepID=UPI00288F88AE|nr:hypothetical protein [Lactococcus lactis]MDT2867632.1 hypothetical protein [Lactococcus lactis]MDT2874492.1 hypothetical protein [Lactococcus lactis]MDT2895330.1 hypothetical protein [Lactococcus lactis]MDT2919237.1 hypothetical protein [Lactococcus lactis]MDT2935632.1 hypothetical protein [Lactococcus lactis]
MKKIKIVGTLILLSTLVLFTGCENKKTDSTSNSKSKVSETKKIERNETISQHFTDDLKDEIWFEVKPVADNKISGEALITAVIVTNQSQLDSKISTAFTSQNMDKGYFFTRIKPSSLYLDSKYPTFNQILQLYLDGTLQSNIYEAYMNVNKSLKDAAKVGLGEGSYGFGGGVYTYKPDFFHALKDGKLSYQSIDFKGNIKFNGEDFFESPDSQYYNFNAYADIQTPLESNNKIIGYANGFIGSNDDTKTGDNDDNKIVYLINISNTKNKIELDPLYSNKDIKTFTR